MTRESITHMYRENIRNYTEKSDQLKKTWSYFVIFRLISFGLIVLFSVFSIKFYLNYFFLCAVIFSFVLFFYFVKRSLVLVRQREYYENLTQINKNEELAVKHDFSCFNGGEEFIDPSHPFSFDLDLFGEGSLFQQINRCISLSGKKKLAKWLSYPLTEIPEILNRQEAVKEIAGSIKLRQDFMAAGFGKKYTDRFAILQWIQKIHPKRLINYYKVVGIVLSINSLIIIVLFLLHLLHFSMIFFLLAFNGIFIFSAIKTINKEHVQLSRQYDRIMQYAEQIKLIEDQHFVSKHLIGLKEKILGNDLSGSRSLRQLAKIINAFDYRLNFLVGMFLNGFFFWDFFCMVRLYRWKVIHRQQLTEWFDVLDEFDTLQSIGNYTYNNPSYIFPSFSIERSVFSGKELCHPQIEPEKRITNDLIIDQKGVFLIITGPNMAGKSTFLRTIGISIVLSQAGAPVCARQLAIRPVKLYSSMRTADSLYKHESYFFAELKRLREIIEAASQNENIFIILDEILKGTNSKDKADGSKAFMKKITALHATGIVATHDLSLGELESEMPAMVHNYCFEAETDGDTVAFDYRLKRGITTKMNASILMKQMGII